jgi:hypothetical protein
MANKFTGICMLISALIIATAIVLRGGGGAAQSQVGRYQFHPSTPPGVIWILDTTTGKVTSQSG